MPKQNKIFICDDIMILQDEFCNITLQGKSQTVYEYLKFNRNTTSYYINFFILITQNVAFGISL